MSGTSIEGSSRKCLGCDRRNPDRGLPARPHTRTRCPLHALPTGLPVAGDGVVSGLDRTGSNVASLESG
jgi:hypothetical protein